MNISFSYQSQLLGCQIETAGELDRDGNYEASTLTIDGLDANCIFQTKLCDAFIREVEAAAIEAAEAERIPACVMRRAAALGVDL